MKRPSFQFYPGDWRNNAKLRRCSEAARGAWMDVLCVLHDSDEYGVSRWPLADLARAAGVPLRLVKELATKDVLKGDDRALDDPLVYTPRSGRKNGEPVVLVDTQPGPIWYSSRMVRDEYVRTHAGASSRFGANKSDEKTSPSHSPKQSPKPSPRRRQGEDLSEDQSDGSSSSSSTSLTDTPLPPASGGDGWMLPDWVPADLWAEFEAVRKKRKKPMTDRARQLAVSKLDALRGGGHDVKKLIEQTILHSWDTFYPIKVDSADMPRDTDEYGIAI